jgi:5-hydroxyisourate hydrolase-like protein (transthyretin family)
MKKSTLNILIVLLVLLGLTTSATAQNTKVKVDQDSQIDKLLEFKKDLRTVDIYKIQIYSGDRSGAERVKNSFSSFFNDIPASMEFNTPNYKIWVGNFTNRLEAERALVKIKKEYANAFIFKPKVNLKS